MDSARAVHEPTTNDLDAEALAFFAGWSATRKALTNARTEIDRLIRELATEHATADAQRELIAQLKAELTTSFGREALAIAHAARVEAISDAARQSLGQKPDAAPAAAWLTSALDGAKVSDDRTGERSHTTLS